MIELRKTVLAYLKVKHQRVYFQDAPTNAVYPYVTFDFAPIIDDGEGYQLTTLDIDGWDLPADGSTLQLETLMESINGTSNIEGINKKTLSSNDITATFYLESEFSLRDDDPRIKRRKYTYSVKLFRRD